MNSLVCVKKGNPSCYVCFRLPIRILTRSFFSSHSIPVLRIDRPRKGFHFEKLRNQFHIHVDFTLEYTKEFYEKCVNFLRGTQEGKKIICMRMGKKWRWRRQRPQTATPREKNIQIFVGIVYSKHFCTRKAHSSFPHIFTDILHSFYSLFLSFSLFFMQNFFSPYFLSLRLFQSFNLNSLWLLL